MHLLWPGSRLVVYTKDVIEQQLDLIEVGRRRTPQHFYAFDILWLDGKDLRGLPLLERKQILRGVVPVRPAPVLYVEHFDARGVDLFRAVCENDLEGDRCQAEGRPVHARGDLLGEDQESAVQPGRGSSRTVRETGGRRLMRLTLKAINAELAKRGHQAMLEKGDGYFYFRGGEAVDWLDRTVTVPTVSSLTLDQWMQAFRDLQKKNAEIRQSGKPAGRPKGTRHAGE